MSDLRVNTSSTNNTHINPSVTPKFLFEGKFNYPVITLGSNNFDGAISSIDGGRHWEVVDTLEYNTEYTFITGNGLGSYMNMSPNLMDVCVWSWSQGGAIGPCFQHLSHDAGRTWITTQFDNSKHEYSHYNYNTNNIYLGGWQGGAKKSVDAGDTFFDLSMVSSQQPVIFDSSDDENYVYAGMVNTKSVQYSTNQGTSWTNVSVSTDGSSNSRVVKCDATGQYVFAYYGTYSITADFSDDYGQSYTQLENSANSRVEIRRDSSCFSYTSPSTGRIYFSTDQGSSWTYITSPWGTDTGQIYRQDYVNNEIYLYCRNFPEIYKITSENNNIELVKTLDFDVWIYGCSQYGRGHAVTASDNGSEGDVYFSRNTQTWELIREKDSTNIGRYPTIL